AAVPPGRTRSRLRSRNAAYRSISPPRKAGRHRKRNRRSFASQTWPYGGFETSRSAAGRSARSESPRKSFDRATPQSASAARAIRSASGSRSAPRNRARGTARAAERSPRTFPGGAHGGNAPPERARNCLAARNALPPPSTPVQVPRASNPAASPRRKQRSESAARAEPSSAASASITASPLRSASVAARHHHWNVQRERLALERGEMDVARRGLETRAELTLVDVLLVDARAGHFARGCDGRQDEDLSDAQRRIALERLVDAALQRRHALVDFLLQDVGARHRPM